MPYYCIDPNCNENSKKKYAIYNFINLKPKFFQKYVNKFSLRKFFYNYFFKIKSI